MKRLILTFIAVLFFSLFLSVDCLYAQEKLAYVDLAQLFEGYSKTKEYDKILETKQKDYENEREKKLEEVRKSQEKLSLLSEEEREARRGELETQITQLQEFDRSTTQDLRKQRDERVQEIFSDIEKSIDTYAKQEGLTFIFDKRALVYENESLDVTKQVEEILNKK